MQYLDPQMARQIVNDRQGRLRDEASRDRLARPARRRGNESFLRSILNAGRDIART